MEKMTQTWPLDKNSPKDIPEENPKILKQGESERWPLDKNSPEVEEKLKKESKTIISRGKMAIVAGLLSLSSGINSYINREKRDLQETKKEWLTQRFDQHFKNVDLEQSKEILADLHNIINDKDLKSMLDNPHDTLLPNIVLDKEGRDLVKKINSQYQLQIWDLHSFNKQRKLLESKDIQDKISELRREFPMNYIADINSLPIGNENSLEQLNDPVYFEGLKRLSRICMLGAGWRDVKEVKLVAENDEYYKLLKDLNSLGTSIDAVAIYETMGGFFKDTTGYDKEWLEESKANAENLKKFVYGNNPNKNVLKYGNINTNLNYWTVEYLIDDKSGEYNNFFKDEKNREHIQHLEKIGYDLEFVIKLINRDMGTVLDNPKMFDVLTILRKNIDWNEGVLNFLEKIKPYYDLSNSESVDILQEDLSNSYSKQIQDSDKFIEDNIKGRVQEHTYSNLKDKVNESDSAEDVSFKRFLKDPALDNIIYKLGYQTRPPEYIRKHFNAHDRSEWIMRTARNMYMNNIPATKDNFQKIFYKSIEVRNNEEILNTSLFKNRNIAFFINNEKDQTGYIRFGRIGTQTAIMNQNPNSMDRFYSNSEEVSELEKTKNNFLNYISSHEKLTVLVDAHGGEDAISLSNDIKPGDVNKKISEKEYSNMFVTSSEMAEAIKQRYQMGIKDIPIIVMSACFSQNFIRNLSNKIQHLNDSFNLEIPIPIAIGSSEYGQYGYSDLEDKKYGSKFLRLLLDDKKDTKIKDILEIEEGFHQNKNNMESNISVFIPTKKEDSDLKIKKLRDQIFFQIAENNTPFLDKVSAIQYMDNLLDKKVNNGKNAFFYEYTRPDQAAEIKKLIESSTG